LHGARSLVGAAFGVALAWLLSGCGGAGLAAGAAQRGHSSPLPAPRLLPADAQLRAASGPPAGIHLSWTLVNDPGVAGYYLYRDSQAIPDPPPDETIDPALRVNSGNPIPSRRPAPKCRSTTCSRRPWARPTTTA
jgi:hypothetical protein